MSKLSHAAMMLLVVLSLGVLRVGATAELPAWADAPPLSATEVTTVIASPPSITAEAAVCSAPTSSGGTSYKAILTPIMDTYAASSAPDTNYGASTELIVGMVIVEGEERAFIAFDLSVLPLDAVILTTTLELYQLSGPEYITEPQFPFDAWTEYGVTWTDQPNCCFSGSVPGQLR